MENKNKLQTLRTMLISFGIVFLMFVLVCVSSHLMFETNDDVFMKMILSGEYTGTPSPYVIHMNIIVGLIISSLYRIIPIIPFYSLFFILVLFFSFFYILFITIKHFDNKKIIPWIVVCFCVLFVTIFSGFLIEMQFTLVASIAGACGLYGLYFINLSDKKIILKSIPIILLFAISFSIRESVLLMLIPFVVVIIVKYWRDRRAIINLISLLGVITCLIIALFIIDKVAYNRSEDWSDFKKYNSNRANIVDLYAVPQYETYNDIYSELGITQSSYLAFIRHYCTELDESYNLDSLQKLNDIAVADYKKKIQVNNLISIFFENQFNKENIYISMTVFSLYILSIYVAIILYRKERKKGLKKRESVYMSLSIMLLFMCRSILWAYMVVHDKTPRRVTNGLFFIELLLLIAFLIQYAPQVLNKKIIICFVSLIVAISIFFGLNNYISTNKNANTYYLMSYIYDDIRKYTDEHSDSIFLCDTFSFAYFVNNDIKLEEEHIPNLIILGGWTANSPWHNDIYKRYDVDNVLDEFVKGERVYFIVQRTEGDDASYLKDYIDEATGRDNNLQIYDSIICGKDNATLIYDIYKVY